MFKNKKVLVSIFVLVIAILLGLGLWWFLTKDRTNDTSGVEYNPPTTEEKQEADDNKKAVVDRMDQEKTSTKSTSPSSTTSKKNVTVLITYYGQNPDNNNAEVNGYVEGVYEDGGTCTLTLNKGTKTVSASRTALKDAQTTTCGLNDIARSKLSPGNWSAKLAYTSKTAQGISTPVTIEVK